MTGGRAHHLQGLTRVLLDGPPLFVGQWDPTTSSAVIVPAAVVSGQAEDGPPALARRAARFLLVRLPGGE
jgi:hypothetical protein